MPIGLLLAACDGFETAGLDALVDDEESYISFPGERRAEVRVERIDHLSSPVLGTTLLGTTASHDLVVAPLQPGGPCVIPAVDEYDAYWRFGGGAMDPDGLGFLAVREAPDSAGFGALRFVDLACQELGPPLADAMTVNALADLRPVYALEGSPGPRVLVTNREGELHEFRPGSAEWARLALDVSQVVIVGGYIWTVEGGELVVRDESTEEVLRTGSAVTELMSWPAADAVYAIDAAGLSWFWSDLSGGGQTTLTDACELTLAWGFGDALSVLSPCAERRLWVVDGAQGVTELGVGAASPAMVSSMTAAGGGSLVAYVAADSESPSWPVGTLHAGPLGGELPVVAESAVLGSVVLGMGPQGESLAVVDWDGTAGRLVGFDASGAARELARGVPGFGPFYDGFVLTDFDGTAGTLARLGPDGPAGIVAEDVAPGRHVAFDCRVFLADYDGETGRLVVDCDDTGLETVAEGVRPGDFALGPWASIVVLYRREVDAATGRGTLGIFFPETRNQFEVDGVTAWHPVTFPDPGLAYSVDDGSRTGMWFARAQ